MRLESLSNLLQDNSKQIPFTRQQADAICQYYQRLIGTPFDGQQDHISSISCVAITPFYEDEKKTFIKQHYPFADTSYKDGLNGQFFDVVIIAHLAHDDEVCFYKDIFSYAVARGIHFNPDFFLKKM